MLACAPSESSLPAGTRRGTRASSAAPLQVGAACTLSACLLRRASRRNTPGEPRTRVGRQRLMRCGRHVRGGDCWRDNNTGYAVCGGGRGGGASTGARGGGARISFGALMGGGAFKVALEGAPDGAVVTPTLGASDGADESCAVDDAVVDAVDMGAAGSSVGTSVPSPDSKTYWAKLGKACGILRTSPHFQCEAICPLGWGTSGPVVRYGMARAALSAK